MLSSVVVLLVVVLERGGVRTKNEAKADTWKIDVKYNNVVF